jgi:putative peptide zinc metalloprotease protein
VQRAAAGIAAAALVAGVAWAWWPDAGTYRPIQAYERGSLRDAVQTALPGAAPTGLAEGRRGTAQALWPSGGALPTAERPRLAVVMVPRDAQEGTAQPATQSGPPTWVFPFDRPLPPADGDNQALAVNTTDGSTQYDVAFALVWADEDTVVNANEAYAIASCTGCRTVAVAFQVVLVVGQADIVVPENVGVAVNYACVACVTQALATQLVVTLPGPLGDDALSDLAALWREIAAFGETIEGLPLSEVRSRLTEYERRILEVLGVDPTAGTPAGGTATSSPTATTGAPTGGASDSGTSPPAGATASPGSTGTTAGQGSTTQGTPGGSTSSASTSTPSSPTSGAEATTTTAAPGAAPEATTTP